MKSTAKELFLPPIGEAFERPGRDCFEEPIDFSKKVSFQISKLCQIRNFSCSQDPYRIILIQFELEILRKIGLYWSLNF